MPTLTIPPGPVTAPSALAITIPSSSLMDDDIDTRLPLTMAQTVSGSALVAGATDTDTVTPIATAVSTTATGTAVSTRHGGLDLSLFAFVTPMIGLILGFAFLA
ncbi:MAG: hypothetical protein M1814_001096 [Vezdaea aestivalis]|nr:MAG: hypothetical protein M1814_001096 [Vezdaea aestivalis]